MKQAIVTGATGFIGSSFVKYLVEKKIDVLSLGRKPFKTLSKIKKKKILGSTYLSLNMKKIGLLEKKLKKINWIIGNDCVFFNLAWGGKDGLSDLNVEAQLSNISWCVSALKISAKIGCKKFIQVGTMEEAFTNKYLELNHHNNNEYNRHVIYSVAKISAKNALKIVASQLNMKFIYVLHSHVMGPDDDKDSFLQVTLEKIINKKNLIFSSGEQYFDVISTDDCVLGYYLICKKGKHGSEYWVGSGKPQRLKDYVRRMYNLFPSGKNLQFGDLPYNDIILNKKDFSTNLLSKDTGYRPKISFEQTVKKLYESMFK